MFKEMFLKQMLKSKLGHLPKDQQDKIIKAMTENPEFFDKIAKEIQEKTKEGKDQMTAAMEVMQANQAELQKIMGS